MKYQWITIDNERVAVKKSLGTWRVVHPIKNEDNSINWKNLLIGGSWLNLVILIVILFVGYGLINEYLSNLKLASACLRALPDYIDLTIYLKNPTLNYTSLLP